MLDEEIDGIDGVGTLVIVGRNDHTLGRNHNPRVRIQQDDVVFYKDRLEPPRSSMTMPPGVSFPCRPCLWC